MAWVEMEVHLLRDDEGGRKGWVSYGYRPSVCFDDVCYESVWNILDKVKIYPGDKAKIRALLTSRGLPMDWDALTGKQFDVREGPKRIGAGVIISIIETDVYQKQIV